MACLVELRQDTKWPTSPGFPVEVNQNKETEQILNPVFHKIFLKLKTIFEIRCWKNIARTSEEHKRSNTYILICLPIFL